MRLLLLGQLLVMLGYLQAYMTRAGMDHQIKPAFLIAVAFNEVITTAQCTQ